MDLGRQTDRNGLSRQTMDKGWHNPMGVRERFSQNLRRLSATKKSHAQVARDLGINRQQFNNYVTGKNLPNESVIDNICRYFKVDLEDMFAKHSNNELTFDFFNQYQKNVLHFFHQREIKSQNFNLKNGLYFIDYSLPYDGKEIIQSLIAINNDNGICSFRRITNLNTNGGKFRPSTQSVHVGVALFRANLLFLFGLDRFNDYYPSFHLGYTIPSSKIIYAGIATVRTGSQFRDVPFAITEVGGEITVADALKQASARSTSDVSNQDEVKHFLNNIKDGKDRLFNYR
jgi:transcriptional regulator with XRE-family HTH domain